MPYSKQELEIVELDAETHQVINHYETLKIAAEEKDVSKQAIHQALTDGSVCAGSRWRLRRFTREVPDGV